ncbi:S-methyl-5'-thioinosine phosphorylase [Parahaliea maris]|uniref:Probable 6-oxopurine nucleoside phosphorylase n=1 Tax=Parahaliea maris TaxID=2716870 RepID=A0A5C8ZZD1_9GAMM|nr:S-methyl-5'-thioinosine phosphorylase [Parahaliea maris]TXS92982.1 S-methyl-5'-thioinosine phosphorylase [Parahaliea maris]
MTGLAIIGGTGIAELDGLVVYREHAVDTPFGAPSGSIQEGRLGEAVVYFLHRHGGPATIPPHRINYRANLWALHSLGVGAVVGINAVGGITGEMRPGRLLIPDQLIDYTWGREHTFDDGLSGELLHVDFTEPYDRELRQALIGAADQAAIDCEPGGVHGVMQGPRLETAAEVRRLARDGCDVVGMTGMPEAALARELGLPYASVCMVVNAAAGLGDVPLSLAIMHQILAREAGAVRKLLETLVARRALQDAR